MIRKPAKPRRSPVVSGSAVAAWLKEQLWLYEAWAKHGPGCLGFWAKDPEKQRRDFEEIRDWLREIVGQSNDQAHRSAPGGDVSTKENNE